MVKKTNQDSSSAPGKTKSSATKPAKSSGVSRPEKSTSNAGKSERSKKTEKLTKDAAHVSSAGSVSAEGLKEVAKEVVDEKLQKVLARAGVGSRREMERAIEAGQVKVNDRTATLGDRVTAKDKIFFNGHRVAARSDVARRRVILYNKPEGEICSRSDPEGRRTVYDGLPALKGERWVSVGRLDFNTSGLLLFTNDGELANKLMHPSSVIDREYLVRIQGDVTDEMRKNLLTGVELEDGVAKFTDIVDGAGESRNRWFYCVVMEGRNREVRRLWESQGVKVSRLKRVRYANIFIPSHVRVGQWIELSEKEIVDLCRTAGFEKSSHTKLTKPTRDEAMQQARHEKKLRAASAPVRRFKPAPRKTKPSPE
jgi:23S rRNA pseudouridine2605 synthase